MINAFHLIHLAISVYCPQKGMLDQNSLIFLAIGLIGLGVMIFGFKFVSTARKVIETVGAVLFHVGIFGIIFLKAPLNLFVSLVAVVTSLFILIDPLKIGPHLHNRIFKLFGFIALFVSVIFFLEYFTGFPVWLWTIPIALYLLPYLIPPLKKIAWFVSLITWFLIFSYVGISGYVLYAHINPGTDTTLIAKMFPQLKLKAGQPNGSDRPDRAVQTALPQQKPQPTPQPFIQQPSPQTPPQIAQPQPTLPVTATPAPQTLQQNYDELKKKYDALVKENEELKKQTIQN